MRKTVSWLSPRKALKFLSVVALDAGTTSRRFGNRFTSLNTEHRSEDLHRSCATTLATECASRQHWPDHSAKPRCASINDTCCHLVNATKPRDYRAHVDVPYHTVCIRSVVRTSKPFLYLISSVIYDSLTSYFIIVERVMFVYINFFFFFFFFFLFYEGSIYSL